MKIDKKQKDELDLAFNESKINYVGIESDIVEVLLNCISMNSNNEFPDDNRFRILFEKYGRIAVSYRKGSWDDESAEIEKIKPNELKSKFHGLILDSMYGWEFLNLDEKQFKDWSDKISLDVIQKSNWSSMNTIDLFAEQIGKDEVTIDIRIWFTDFKIFDFKNRELTKTEFAENGQRGWNQMYKTGISTTDNKTTKL
ncbi:MULTISPECIES: hypothetical protein [Winogradskyella]|uniref:hypothetical protein n=1 Tax=Winogradskyella TaxID=286104 RepID=UPI0015C9D364|nr:MULTISPECIES: hypothetical protein [Winogradskyella]QXP78816.1 hypothetical protein H0I32_16665 [Winogradskyella sp. HaHa_3_26]